MLEASNVKIPDLVFLGWDNPDAIEVYYYEDPETKNKISSGFSVVYPKSKEGLMTPEFMKTLEEFNVEEVVITDENEGLGALQTTYQDLSFTGVEKEGDIITFGFSATKALTYLKPSILD